MNITGASGVNSSYANVTASSFSVVSIQRQIQLYQQQITSIEQSSLEETAKEEQIKVLEARIEALQQRVQIAQSSQTVNTAASTESALSASLSSVSSRDNTNGSNTVPFNTAYQAQGQSFSLNAGIGNLIGYA